MLFYGIVPVENTEEVVIPVSDSLGSFTVEAFAMRSGDWTDTRATVVVDKPVRVDLELPPAVDPGDKVVGRLRAATPSGKARIRLTCDGDPVELEGAGETCGTPVELELDVRPGRYVATVEDVESGESDTMELFVGEPGVFKSYAKELGLLLTGDRITLDSADALSLRVLPAVDASFDSLVRATAGYGHLCCEQTAAKILAATFMVLTAKREGDRRDAEAILLAGIEREKQMLRPGRGFAMYPENSNVNEHYSKLAVRYLWSLEKLQEVPDLSPPLRRAAKIGLDLAHEAARAHRMEPAPKTIQSFADAYAAVTNGGDRTAAQKFLSDSLDLSSDEIRPTRLEGQRGQVASRAALAYAAATFIATEQFEPGVRLANQVTRQFNENGALYSTVDSVAAVVLMIELRASGLITAGSGRLRVNGEERTALEAAALTEPLESIEVLEGVAAVELTTIREENWNDFNLDFPLRVGFHDAKNKSVDAFRMGDRVDLVLALPQGYRPGDLAQVSLPACMSWLQGGGKVKRFSMDFEGKDELRVPVIVTSKIEGQQRFALCVRNMFEEERVTSPGLLTVKGRS